MMQVLQELRERSASSLADAHTAYRGIVHRAARDASEAGDAALLVELLPKLKKTAADFDRDIKVFGEYLQTEENLAAAGTPGEIDADVAEKYARAKAAYEAMETAQKSHFAAAGDLHRAQARIVRRELLAGAVRTAKAACGDLFPD